MYQVLLLMHMQSHYSANRCRCRRGLLKVPIKTELRREHGRYNASVRRPETLSNQEE